MNRAISASLNAGLSGTSKSPPAASTPETTSTVISTANRIHHSLCDHFVGFPRSRCRTAAGVGHENPPVR
jgi:hypothetical protein